MLKEQDDLIDCLSSLSIIELNNFLTHLRRGYDYLSKLVGSGILNDLLEKIKLDSEKEKIFEAHFQEKAGRIILFVNTMTTSLLGAFLGFLAFSQYRVNNIITIMILLMSLAVGAIAGYLVDKNVDKRLLIALQTQKLLKLQEKIQSEIFLKRKNLCKASKKDIINISEKIVHIDSGVGKSFADEDFLLKENLLIVRNYVQRVIVKTDDSEITKFYAENAKYLLRSIEKYTNLLFETIERKDKNLNPTSKLSSRDEFLQKLIAPCAAQKRQNSRFHEWVSKNTLDILIGFTPTILGGFASLFVFLNGFPDIYRHLHLQIFDESLFVYYKLCSFILVLIITVYFGYSYIHFNYQDYKRSLLLEESSKKILETDNKILQLVSHHTFLIRIKSFLKQLKIILPSLKFFNSLIDIEEDICPEAQKKNIAISKNVRQNI